MLEFKNYYVYIVLKTTGNIERKKYCVIFNNR
jgi:hypothetical protein